MARIVVGLICGGYIALAAGIALLSFNGYDPALLRWVPFYADYVFPGPLEPITVTSLILWAQEVGVVVMVGGTAFFFVAVWIIYIAMAQIETKPEGTSNAEVLVQFVALIALGALAILYWKDWNMTEAWSVYERFFPVIGVSITGALAVQVIDRLSAFICRTKDEDGPTSP